MELLELEGMVGIPSPHLTKIKPFDQIIKRDDSDEKRQASRELAYIHFMVHYESPYISYPKKRRPEKIIKDIWGDKDEWQPDDLIKEGVKQYKKMIESPYTRLLDSSWEAANKLIDHFDNLHIEDTRDAKETINNLSKVGEVVEGIEKVMERVKAHESKQNENRAGAKTNKYSEG